MVDKRLVGDPHQLAVGPYLGHPGENATRNQRKHTQIDHLLAAKWLVDRPE